MSKNGDDNPEMRRPIRRRLLAWYDRCRRDLPWRRTRDPYRVWISETMLQQTQVTTVIPYYRRFIRAFPTVQQLADAALDDVLAHWAGLGYYARAANLHRAARMIVTEFGGRLPDSVEELRRLPGIGPYSAAAVASIAFGKRAAVLDGNVLRVLSRVFAVKGNGDGPALDRHLHARAQELLPLRRCGDFNQALMELGATVCLPGKAARCGECPLAGYCKAAAAGRVADYPPKRRTAAVRSRIHAVAALRRKDKWLVVRRGNDGLWGGLWELPTVETRAPGSARRDALKLAMRLTGHTCTIAQAPFCDLTRQLTHRLIRFVGYEGRVNSGRLPGQPANSARWLRANELALMPMSTAMKKVVAALGACPPHSAVSRSALLAFARRAPYDPPGCIARMRPTLSARTYNKAHHL